MRKYILICIIFLLALLNSGCSVKRPGFLLSESASTGANGPREGDIKLRDEHGGWYIVEGFPVNPPPFTDQSITVAVIDSGVISDHPQLKGLIAEQKDFTGEGPEDRIGHGTVVTIIFVGSYLTNSERILGVRDSPSPRMIVAKVVNADGTIDKNIVISAIEWVAQQGAKVVNLSLGFREGTGDYSDLCYVIAQHPEIEFIAAAGNFGPNVKLYPAACSSDNLISVGLTDSWSGKGDIVSPSEKGKYRLISLPSGEIANTAADLKNNKRTIAYVVSPPMLETMLRLGMEQDRKLGLQLDCKSQYKIKPFRPSVWVPIVFPDDKQHPTRGMWRFCYQLERCGESKFYNAVFTANSNGEAPTPSAYYPGSTNAGRELVKDAMLLARNSALVRSRLKDCKNVDVFDMRVTEPAHDVVKGNITVEGVWNEIWTFRACGQMIDVALTFIPNSIGFGTTITIDPAKVGDATAKPR